MEINLLPDYLDIADVDILDDCDGGLIDVARCKFGWRSNPNETGITNKGACPAEKNGMWKRNLQIQEALGKA